MAQGKTNYEIGVMLGARTRTICKHVERVLVKLNVENRTAAAAIAIAALRQRKKTSDLVRWCGMTVAQASWRFSAEGARL